MSGTGGRREVSVRDLVAGGACIASVFVSVVSCVGLFDIHDDCFALILVLGLVLQGLVLVVVVVVPALLLRPPTRSEEVAAYLRKLHWLTVAGIVVEVAHLTLRHYTAQYHGGHCI